MTEKKIKIPSLATGFITDEKKEVEGESFQLSNGKFAKIGRWNNKEHAKLVSSLRKPHIMRNGRPKPSLEKAGEDIMIQSMAKTILLGWKDNEDDDWYYEFEAAKESLSAKDLMLEVFEISQERANFLAEEKKADAKNS